MTFDNYTIRLLRNDDLHDYFQMVDRNRKRLESFFTGTVSKTKTLEDTTIFLNEITKKAEARTYFPFVIVDTANNAFAGFIDVKNIDWGVPKAELGCYMDEQYAGKKITAKALELFTAHCFREYGFRKLFLRTHRTNTAARKIAEKCGFEVEGIIRRDYKTTAGELVDLVYYGKLGD